MKYLSVCVLVRNESFYLEEYLEWNLLQGVEHFYIYHNMGSGVGEGQGISMSDIHTEKILQNYADLGIVTIINWPYFPGQFSAYTDCLERFKDDSEWIGFFDCDEFLYYTSDRDIKFFLDHDVPKDAGGVAIHWYLFGSNGQKQRTDELVIERFSYRQIDVNNHVKNIVRPNLVEFSNKDAHTFFPKPGYFIYDEHQNKMPEYYATTPGTADYVQIRHYHTKSYEEYVKRKSVGSPDYDKPYELDRIDVMFPFHDRNEFLDPIPEGLINLLKEAIRNRSWNQ